MGYYINPVNSKTARDKREIILAESEPVSRKKFMEHRPGHDGKFGVAIVDNGLFIAAAIAVNVSERETFGDTQGRPVDYCIIAKNTIAELDPMIYAEMGDKYD